MTDATNPTARAYVIAEAGVNHNGDPDRAAALVDAAADAGADAVKFQTFKAEAVVTAGAKKAAYQIANTKEEGSQIDMIRQLELGFDTFEDLAERARARGIDFLSTAFDGESLAFLAERIGVEKIKVPSGEVTNGPYVLACARLGRPIILSTGMCDMEEIADALDLIAHGYLGRGTPKAFAEVDGLAETTQGRAALADKVTILHCTTEYPTPMDEVNLRAMDAIRERFALSVGYSDHTTGITVPIAAVARGAAMIEKHFTMDRALPGPDHAASLEPDELAAMVTAIRATESALGVAEKKPVPSEIKNIAIARRSLVAARAIAAGETFTEDALAAKRPGDGLSPMHAWALIGRPASRTYAPDETIEEPVEG